MKNIRILPVLIGLCTVLAVAAVISVIRAGSYDPERYITLADYRHITVQNPTQPVTQNDVSRALAALLGQLAQTEEVTDGAADGDTVTFDWQLQPQSGDPLSGSEQTAVLGEESFLPGLDAALRGGKVGDVIQADLAVPEDSFMVDYAGQTVSLTATVTAVTRTETPVLNDDLAKQLGYSDVQAFKQAFEAKYRLDREQTDEAALRNALWEAVLEATEVKEYPAKEITELREEWLAELDAGAAEYEMERVDYASFMYGLNDEEAIETYLQRYCETVMKNRLVLDAICKREQITLTDEEYRDYMERYLELSADEGFTEEKLLEVYGGEEGMREQFLKEKATDVIRETATIQ